jgi:hypothetical protein
VRNTQRTDRVLNDEEASDLYQMEIEQSRAEIDKAQAYSNFFDFCRQRLISFGAKTIGDLSVEEQEIISQKLAALVEKYGPVQPPEQA